MLLRNRKHNDQPVDWLRLSYTFYLYVVLEYYFLPITWGWGTQMGILAQYVFDGISLYAIRSLERKSDLVRQAS